VIRAAAFFLLAAAAAGQTVRGTVTDLATGEPLAGAFVAVRGGRLTVETDRQGRFELPDLAGDEVELCARAAGYGPVCRMIRSGDGAVELRLSRARILRGITLEGSDLRNLSSALFADVFRSVQSLPGVGAGDDFYAQFGYRGAAAEDVGVYLDGVPLRDPLHGVRDAGNLGSVSLVNPDVVDSVSLEGSVLRPQFGDGTAGALNIVTREPGRERTSARVTAGIFETAATFDGPLGENASWLASVRKSYLQYFVNNLGREDLGLGYSDATARLLYNVGARHRLTLTALGASTGLDSGEDNMTSIDTITAARSRTALGQLGWSWTPRPAVSLKTSAYFEREDARNRNPGGAPLLDAAFGRTGIRHDATVGLDTAGLIEAGVELRRTAERYHRYAAWDFELGFPGSSLVPVAAFSTPAWQSAAYAQYTWTGWKGRLHASGGGRWERFSYTGEATLEPRASLAIAAAPGLLLTAAFGRYTRFPELEELLGPFPNPRLRARRSDNAALGAELRVSARTRLRVETYRHEIEHIAYSEAAEWRISGGSIIAPLFGSPLGDSLCGYSRGAEVTLERRGTRLAGWISYAWGHARNRDPETGLAFDADFDQRHIVNAYAAYRASSTVSLAGRYRYTSNVPVAGFYRGDDPVWLSDQRNQLRIPPFSRLDVRLNKTLRLKRAAITAYAEVANLLNGTHRRYVPFDKAATFSSVGWVVRDTMLPIVPAGGLTIAF
jgi:hypothetical protein